MRTAVHRRQEKNMSVECLCQKYEPNEKYDLFQLNERFLYKPPKF